MKRIPATSKNINNWEDIPLIKLSEILKQTVWFTDYDILLEFNTTENYYEKYNTVPYYFELDMTYRKESITIKCLWEERETPYSSEVEYYGRFAIGVEYPCNYRFQTPRWRVDNQTILKYTRFYSVAINKIEDSIYEAQEYIDEEIAEKENEKRREAKLKIIRENLCKNLNVNIIKKRYSSSFVYRQDNKYHLDFESEDETGEFFTIDEIGGAYTQEDIKKMIEIVGGNPRAIAERLTK